MISRRASSTAHLLFIFGSFVNHPFYVLEKEEENLTSEKIWPVKKMKEGEEEEEEEEEEDNKIGTEKQSIFRFPP